MGLNLKRQLMKRNCNIEFTDVKISDSMSFISASLDAAVKKLVDGEKNRVETIFNSCRHLKTESIKLDMGLTLQCCSNCASKLMQEVESDSGLSMLKSSCVARDKNEQFSGELFRLALQKGK